MSTTVTHRYKLRRNTAAQWADLNPVLLLAEPGVVIDGDGAFVALKMGDGSTLWLDLPYAVASPADLAALEAAIDAEAATRTAADVALATNVATAIASEAAARATADALLVPLTQKGAANGVATLDTSSLIPDAQIPATIARDAEITAAVNALIDAAPGALNTLNELAAALGDDPNFATTVTNALAGKLAKASNLSDLADIPTARATLIPSGTYAETQTAGVPLVAANRANLSVNVCDAPYNAVPDGLVVTDGAMTATSAVLTSASALFLPGDVGKLVAVTGAGAVAVNVYKPALATTIASYQSPTQVTLAIPAVQTVSGAMVVWGTDNRVAIQSAINHAALLGGGSVYGPRGRFLISYSGSIILSTPGWISLYPGLVMYSNVHLVGDGMGATILQPSHQIGTAPGAFIMAADYDQTGFSLSKLSLIGQAPVGAIELSDYAIGFGPQSDWKVSECEVAYWAADAICAFSASAPKPARRVTVDGNFVHDCVGQALEFGQGLWDSAITDNTCWHSLNSDAGIGAEVSDFDESCKRVIISRNRFLEWGPAHFGAVEDTTFCDNIVTASLSPQVDGGGTGPAVRLARGSTNLKILRNYLDTSETLAPGVNNGIESTSLTVIRRLQIKDNTIVVRSTSPTLPSSHIQLATGVEGLTISGNDLVGGALSPGDPAQINLQNCTDVKIVDNDHICSGGTAIAVQNGCERISIGRNTVKDGIILAYCPGVAHVTKNIIDGGNIVMLGLVPGTVTGNIITTGSSGGGVNLGGAGHVVASNTITQTVATNPAIKENGGVGKNHILFNQLSNVSGDILSLDAAAKSVVMMNPGVPDAYGPSEPFGVALSDESTAITTGVKATVRMPYAMVLTAVRSNLNTASSSGLVTVDIKEGGVSILSTLLSIDSGEKTSTTAATPSVISDVVLADDAEVTFEVTAAGTAAKGLKVWLIGYVP